MNLNSAGNLQVQATEILQFKEDNCTPEAQIKIGIRKCGTGNGFPFDGNQNPLNIVNFACPDTGVQCIELWAIDKAGNADFCTTNIIIQDNLNNCGNVGFNRIITEQGAGISDVSIEIDGTCPFCPPGPPHATTDSLGYYTVSPTIPLSPDFKILPEKDDNPLNGVTTYDLVLISKHILSIEPLNTPYKIISADANKSGSVTSFDIVELRKLILGITAQLPNNTSWRFVDSNFVFPNPLNPFQTALPEKIPVTNPRPFNFIGMKIGDVNLTAVPNVWSLATERFDGTVYFDTEDRLVQENEIFELKCSASEILDGCQFTLDMDGLEVLDILPGENMSKDNFALFPQKSLLTMAWEHGGQANFSLKMKAHQSGALREMIRISSKITLAEAYRDTKHQSANAPITKQQLALRFGHGSNFGLFSTQPNPFTNKTTISFQLPEAGPAVLTVFDGTGKVLWSRSNEWPGGMNSLEIDLTGISAAGVLYCKLETPAQSAVQKMVRI